MSISLLCQNRDYSTNLGGDDVMVCLHISIAAAILCAWGAALSNQGLRFPLVQGEERPYRRESE